MDARNPQRRSSGMSFALLAGGFRFLGWLNGASALALVAFSLGIVGGDIAAPDLQLPLALFLAGLLTSCMGLLFGYLAQVSLLRQGDIGHVTRGHWPAQLLAMICYLLGALAFCAGCWFSLGQVAPGAQQNTSYASR
ncbi:hypothetical protein YH64_002070 [Achromobacter sp. LC458]|uniref:Uncharacterized protein n=1 Tax=Achromobacter spanius TaxID=217203 RepID=A0A2S5GVK2_9BURK|nr:MULTISPECIES: hypothetical protein [Achromobacter]AYD63769.1 hypothetical protein DVB37_07410 [Achromobacter sp. B7]MDX3986856.1 hypothetical protein [Achromobacter sp.]PPA76885.1 hypothetical protein C4E15_08990 [Achromobacter spanius]QYJ23147.1 hypothetical protein KYT87_07930 [Achromobacter sp. ES-001]TRM55053.1 hypothetical protein YH64_002070 [Achromobacter sp. LC458]